ncbi:hypothetical protein M413DRAFT_77523, partial [Hebeloma cylindrosporum]
MRVFKPKHYNGDPDARAYHRFIKESNAYIRDNKFKARSLAAALSYFLDGKAYDFYVQKVSRNEEDWTLNEFYTELFNFCFPINYRMQLRKKLDRTFQNEKSMSDYSHELEELFNMIGSIDEREQVVKFWKGSKTSIQRALWRDGLNPDISSWNEVVSHAEIVEISENVMDSREKKGGDSSSKKGGSNHNPFSSHGHHSRSDRSHSRRPSRGRGHGPGRGGFTNRNASERVKSEPRSTPRLSEKELAERRADGRCFGCNEPGHLARNCPHTSSVKHTGNKPPGKSSFSMELGAVGETCELCNPSSDVLDSLPLGAIEFEEDVPIGDSFLWRPKPIVHEPDWIDEGPAPRDFIGDCYAMMATHVLYDCQPYPGDEHNDTFSSHRFVLIPLTKHYQILDSHSGFRINVPRSLLERPQFDLGSWYAKRRAKALGLRYPGPVKHYSFGDPISVIGSQLLEDGIQSHYPCIDPLSDPEGRFNLYPSSENSLEYIVDDPELNLQISVPKESLLDPTFDLVHWYCCRLEESGLDINAFIIRDYLRNVQSTVPRDMVENPDFNLGEWYEYRLASYESDKLDLDEDIGDISPGVCEEPLELNGVQVDRNKYPTLQRNAARVNDKARILPKPLIITVNINGHPARALLDSGSLGDFMSTSLADQLKVKLVPLEVPLSVQLAVQGSRTRVNSCARVRFQYQGIDEERVFDIININSYDLILGTPWLFQHQVCLGLNPGRCVLGSDISVPIKLGTGTKLMAHAIAVGEGTLESAREELRQYAKPLCKDENETPLPPFRDINHTIPLIDETLKYPWRASRCPEPLRAQWAEKRDNYLRTGRWKITSAGNTVPMLLIPK